ncbi:DNA translocase FtsK [Patescibacteria group bacterium]|nr:DNA translocase FtsK [Patescibacteria group bacterium]MBU4057715.1 DNA translocase FtsK [Patescibacteria group bacterium]MBU4116037.1 DNA translocase FtsK [Patescibacteria group bacterium]
MARKKNIKKQNRPKKLNIFKHVEKETANTVWAILFFVLSVIFVLSAVDGAGTAGKYIFSFFNYLFGIGYLLIPFVLFVLGISFIKPIRSELKILKIISAIVLFMSALGLADLISKQKGGVIGNLISMPLLKFFDFYASIILLIAFFIISLIFIFETKITLDSILFWRRWKRDDVNIEEYEDTEIEEIPEGIETGEPSENKFMLGGILGKKSVKRDEDEEEIQLYPSISSYREYIPPPLSLLQRDKGKPEVGDIKANSNIIKRTLQNFGISVEMDEISIGPTVTRYSLKPAEGVRLSKILGLQNNLELALAAHPVRIEAPIPGKSLVGIEVPNTAKTTVGLGSILSSVEYKQAQKPLIISLGKGISGDSHFGDLSRMPHLLIAGATGSGKSVSIHTIINSLIFRNSPENVKFIMIDSKRVELPLYNGIPHLLTPVITSAKKAILALKWAGKEMEKRYDLLEKNAVRDIQSYHKNILAPAVEKIINNRSADKDIETIEKMPFIIIVVDELADLMHMYPRELESSVVRLAQMSRAVGIHLVLSTQRPSVNVITGLIKANIPTRIALQVASQIDSRTILDGAGAEKLLGSGDMLYLSGEMSKPVRLQSAYVSEKEVKSIVKYLIREYGDEVPDEVDISSNEQSNVLFSTSLGFEEEPLDDDDDLYGEARDTVVRAGKASTSYLQRKLRIGYSRAARLMDILEERGVIGPASGSRPRNIIKSGTDDYDEADIEDKEVEINFDNPDK